MVISFFAAFLGIRVAIPHLRAVGGGVIINTSSISAVRFETAGSIAYTVAKAGLEALTKASALAYGPENIRVNCLRIGRCDTPLIDHFASKAGLDVGQIAAVKSARAASVPLRHEQTSPWSVAAAAIFLASEDARDITGVILNIDGGLELAALPDMALPR